MNDDVLLLVEDNPDDVALTSRAFKEVRFPYQTVVARNGEEALDFLLGTGPYAGRRTRVYPVLILLDLKMPKMGGLEFLRRLQDDPFLKHVVVVVLTSAGGEKDEAEAMGLGARLYVRKPVNYEDFIEFANKVKHMLSALRRSESMDPR